MYTITSLTNIPNIRSIVLRLVTQIERQLHYGSNTCSMDLRLAYLLESLFVASAIAFSSTTYVLSLRTESSPFLMKLTRIKSRTPKRDLVRPEVNQDSVNQSVNMIQIQPKTEEESKNNAGP